MYTHQHTVSSRKRNVTSAISRVESTLHREAVTDAVVRFLASTTGRSVDDYESQWQPPPERQLLSSQQLEYCMLLPSQQPKHADEATTTLPADHRFVPPAQTVALRRFQNHGTPFT